MSDNICHFLPYIKDNLSIQTVNFVLETTHLHRNELKSFSVYTVNYVLKGTGVLHTMGKTTPIKEGDVFFTFPGTPLAVENTGGLKYYYISFIGIRANVLLGKNKITTMNFHFEECNSLSELWKSGIAFAEEVSGTVAEAIVLYTIAFLGNRTLAAGDDTTVHGVFIAMKKYIDDNLNDSELSLKKVGEVLSYNDKYLSDLFKKNMGMGANEYINRMRIQQACAMMEQGFTGISDISYTCGYNDPLYFSKVFKKIMGFSPSFHINNIKNNTREKLQ